MDSINDMPGFSKASVVPPKLNLPTNVGPAVNTLV